MLNLTLPNGTWEADTLKLFQEADLCVLRHGSRSYSATINDPRFAKVKFLRPQEIPAAVASGWFDVGLCGVHSVREAKASVVSVMDLGPGGRAGGTPRIVLAVPADVGIQSARQLPEGVRVATEFPSLAAEYFATLGIKACISFSHGATEGKIPELADAIVEITETGSTLRQAGFIVLDTLSDCSLQLVANNAAWADPPKRAAIKDVCTLLGGVIHARGKVLLKMNVPNSRLDEVIAALPTTRRPTVVPLLDADTCLVEVVILRGSANFLIPELMKHGVIDIIEVPISKMVTLPG